ncbi:MAG: hypothetical protein PUC00_00485 [Clostridiales bacterium]|nr:hypothetical protein [Clostridiales bacterium]
MKHSKLDAVIVSALLLAYVPGLAEEALLESTPAALILPAPAPEVEEAAENPADRL